MISQAAKNLLLLTKWTDLIAMQRPHPSFTGYKLISVEKEKMQSIKVAHERLMSSDSTLRCSITELKKRRWKDRRLGTARS